MSKPAILYLMSDFFRDILCVAPCAGLEAAAPIFMAAAETCEAATGQHSPDDVLARHAYSAACALVCAAQLRSKCTALAGSSEMCSIQSFSILWPACRLLLQRYFTSMQGGTDFRPESSRLITLWIC